MMKYCVNLTLRRFIDNDINGEKIPLLYPLYYETKCLREFNDWLYHHICNNDANDEIISIMFEVVSL